MRVAPTTGFCLGRTFEQEQHVHDTDMSLFIDMKAFEGLCYLDSNGKSEVVPSEVIVKRFGRLPYGRRVG